MEIINWMIGITKTLQRLHGHSYTHRDLKPANVLTDGDNVIIMDLGSIGPISQDVDTRTTAMTIQDDAAQHSTMSFRAPEIMDVKRGSTISEKIDIWVSLHS